MRRNSFKKAQQLSELRTKPNDRPAHGASSEGRPKRGKIPGVTKAVISVICAPSKVRTSIAEAIWRPFSGPSSSQYALVTYTTHVLNDSVGWFYQSDTDPYSGGLGFNSHDPVPPLGNWNDQGGDDDFAFKAYVTPPPSTPSTPPTTAPTTKHKKKCKKHKKHRSAESAKKKKCKKKKRR